MPVQTRIARRPIRPQVEQLEDRLTPSGFQPTAMEQLMLEQLNDARADPSAYGQSIGLNLSGVAAAQPLAFDPLLIQAARLHSQDMNDRRFFDHVNPSGEGPGQRLAAVGFSATSWAESIAAGYTSTAAALAALIKDVGIPDLGHRRHLLAIDAVFQSQNLVGIGVVQNGSGPYKHYYTIDTARTADSRAYLTGAVFVDNNGNGKYDLGEGLSGVTITVSGVGAIQAFDTGGYSFPLKPGTYTVTASGGGLSAAITRTVTIGGSNVRVQFVELSAAAAAQNSKFVSQLYLDVLGRDADAPGHAFWYHQLANGMSRQQVAWHFVNSDEYRYKLALSFYRTYLQREASHAEAVAWMTFLAQGGSRDQMLVTFVASQEYYLKQGGTDAAFVKSLYVNLLGRNPDPGSAYHTWLLANGGTRSQVVAQFLGSLEYRSREVRSYYQAFLNRSAPTSHIQAWAGVLLSGTRQEDVIIVFLGSTEYYQKAGS